MKFLHNVYYIFSFLGEQKLQIIRRCSNSFIEYTSCFSSTAFEVLSDFRVREHFCIQWKKMLCSKKRQVVLNHKVYVKYLCSYSFFFQWAYIFVVAQKAIQRAIIFHSLYKRNVYVHCNVLSHQQYLDGSRIHFSDMGYNKRHSGFHWL